MDGGVGVRSAILLFTAVIGVGGSFLLYLKRRRDARRRLRYALLAEIGKTGDRIYRDALRLKGTELTQSPTAPEESPIVTTAYEANAGEIGRLTDDEIQAITSFYTTAQQVDDRLDRAIGSESMSPAGSIYLRARLIELNNASNTAINEIERELGDTEIDIRHRTDLEAEKPVSIEEARDRLSFAQRGETPEH